MSMQLDEKHQVSVEVSGPEDLEDSAHVCPTCGKSFSCIDNLHRPEVSAQGVMPSTSEAVTCPKCMRIF